LNGEEGMVFETRRLGLMMRMRMRFFTAKFAGRAGRGS